MADVICSVCGRHVSKHFSYRQIAEVQLRRLGPIKSIEKLWLTQADDLKWIAGRCESCDLQINSAYASRKHFLITYKHDKYFISDTGSSNGTYVNDVRITSEQMLEYGNIVSVGVTSDYESLGDCMVYVFEKCNRDDNVGEMNESTTALAYQRRKYPLYENLPGNSIREMAYSPPVKFFRYGRVKSGPGHEISGDTAAFFKIEKEESQIGNYFRNEKQSNFDRLYLQESYV